MVDVGGIAGDQLRSYIERIERLEREKAALASDIRDVFAEAKGNPQGAEGLANFDDKELDGVVESAEECPGECIYIEP